MSNDLKRILQKVCNGKDLESSEALRIFQIMLAEGMTPAQIGSLLTALHIKGETTVEIVSLVKVLKSKCTPFEAPEEFIDNCGTGGDISGSYNISTTCAFILAASGIPVIKHGNKAVSSLSGSADVLQHLGVNIEASREVMLKSLNDTNICFLTAPRFHKSMRDISPVRKELGIRSIFNIAGPLVHPAQPNYQLIGVYSKELLMPIANALNDMGTKKAWIVHGSDGLDEITTTGNTYVVELNRGKIKSFELNPSDYGIDIASKDDLKGSDPSFNAHALVELLNNKGNKAYRDIVILNSAASIVIMEKADNLTEAIEIAEQAIKNGRARLVLDNFVKITNSSIKENK